jgi:hypothetical protein
MPSTQKVRIKTIVAILNSLSSISHSDLNKIKNEFNQVTSIESISPPKRRNIMKVLHSTRALDSTLSSILRHYGIKGDSHSLGQYLRTFQTHNNPGLDKISAVERNKYQASIVKVRNKHLHEADVYPTNESEVYGLLSEMESLLTRIVTL